ncbi:uncharacterized protein LOC133710955 [Rosa rugosa]|uniref:uncharacterized protein LOC133710955 n=1 Tax=Rosa rugosa TaxID=74645 RepID=UPI002B40649D|nr:uncharacterized protein LOC133710955 [Rosa rugosa]
MPYVVSVPPVVDVIDAIRLARLAKEITRLGAIHFQGGTDQMFMLADQWIRNMENYFRMVVCTDLEKREIVIYLFQDEARVWWEGIERARDVTTMTWVDFGRLFKEKYFLASVLEQLEVEFLTIVQGTMSIRDYKAKFSWLYRFVRPWDALSLAKKFQRGLNASLRHDVVPLELPTMALILAKAMELEQDTQLHQIELAASRDSQGRGKAVAESSCSMGHRDGSWKRQRTHQQAPAAEPIRVMPIRQVAPLRCFNCNEIGHTSRDCTRPRNFICFRCGQAGHYSRDCTQAQGRGLGNQQR